MKKLLPYLLGFAVVIGLGFSQQTIGACLTGSSGGTGICTTSSTNVGGVLQVASTSPFLTYQIVSAQVFNVKAYGAKCDGVTDDTTAIQSALDASRGDLLLLCVGTMIVSRPIRYTSGEHITGYGATSTLIKFANSVSGDGNVFETTSTGGIADFSLTNFGIDANGANQTTGTAAVFIHGHDVYLNNINISQLAVINCYAHCIYVTGDNTSKHYPITVHQNYVSNFGVGVVGFGIYMDYAPSTDVAFNVIDNNNGDDSIEIGHLGARVHDNDVLQGPIQFPFGSNSVIANNIIRTGNIQNDANQADYVTITGNHILSSTPATGYAGISVFGVGDMIANNYVRVSTNSGIRVFNGNNATIENNFIDGESSSTGGSNGVYADHSSNISIFGNQIQNFTRAIENVFDNDLISYNTVSSTKVCVDLASSSVSGHVIQGTQIFFNNCAGAALFLQVNDQGTGGYALLNATGTSIGIGTSTPVGAFDVYGTDSLSTNPLSVELGVYNFGTAAIDRGGYIGLGGQTGNQVTTFGAIQGAKENVSGGDSAGVLKFFTRTNSQALTTERMRIDSVGSVGIGTPRPSSTLHVIGNGVFTTGLTVNGTTTLASTTNALLSTNVSGNVSGFGGSSCVTGSLVTSISATGTVACNTTSSILAGYLTTSTFNATGTPWYFTAWNNTGNALLPTTTIWESSSTGNLAFGGSTAPNGAFDFNKGAILINDNLTNNSSRPAVGTSRIAGEINSYSTSAFANNDGFLRLSAGGGTNPTRTYIDLSGFSNTADMNENIVFGTLNTENMRLVASGRLGIGTPLPSSTLHVVGNGIFTTGLAVGTTTTSTATLNIVGSLNVSATSTFTQTSTFSGNVSTTIAINSLVATDNRGVLVATGTPSSFSGATLAGLTTLTGSSTVITPQIGGAIVSGGCDSATTTIDSSYTSSTTAFITTARNNPGQTLGGTWVYSIITSPGLITTFVCANITLTPVTTDYLVKILK